MRGYLFLFFRFLMTVMLVMVATALQMIAVVRVAARTATARATEIVTMIPAFTALLLVLAIGISACATVKEFARDINDVATELCTLTFNEHPEDLPPGLSVEEVCRTKKFLDPFIRHILKAQRDAAGQLGIGGATSSGGEAP
jgi:predicted small secreted protein